MFRTEQTHVDRVECVAAVAGNVNAFPEITTECCSVLDQSVLSQRVIRVGNIAAPYESSLSLLNTFSVTVRGQ